MRKLRLTYPEAEEMFRRMVFNVLATNYDDHTKNFSFILRKDEKWRLAPAYDLCFAYDANNNWVNQQTLSINSKRSNITRDDLMTVAKANTIKKGERIINQINQVVHQWLHYADVAKVNEDLKRHIQSNLNVF